MFVMTIVFKVQASVVPGLRAETKPHTEQTQTKSPQQKQIKKHTFIRRA